LKVEVSRLDFGRCRRIKPEAQKHSPFSFLFSFPHLFLVHYVSTIESLRVAIDKIAYCLQKLFPSTLLRMTNGTKPAAVVPAAATPKKAQPKVPFLRLFRFADKTDGLFYALGILFAVGNGVIFPSFTWIMAGLIDAFFDPNGITAAVSRFSLYMLVREVLADTALACGHVRRLVRVGLATFSPLRSSPAERSWRRFSKSLSP
jgi:hypothetical protein